MQREDFFDSLKFILVFMVVLYHSNNSMYLDNYKFITLLFLSIPVMPLFIFISGYFSKNLTWRKLTMSFIALSLTYLVFQIIYSGNSIVSANFSIVKFFTQPLIGLWYIICLILWRYLIYFITKWKIPIVLVLIVNIAIVVLAGFISAEIPLFKFFVFFPFFAVGYYCPSGIIKKIRGLNKLYSIIFLIIVYITLFFLDPIYVHRAMLGHQFNFGYVNDFYAVLYKVLHYPVAIMLFIPVLNLVPDTFNKLGMKSLDIFLWHPIFTSIYISIKVKNDFYAPLWFDFIATSIIVIICVLLSNFKVAQILVNPIQLFIKKKPL